MGNSLTSGASIVGAGYDTIRGRTNVPYDTVRGRTEVEHDTIRGRTEACPLLDQRPIWGGKSGVERMVWLCKTAILIVLVVIINIIIMIISSMIVIINIMIVIIDIMIVIIDITSNGRSAVDF